MFKKHRKSVDHMLLAMAAVKEGNTKVVARHLAAAVKSRDFALAMNEIDDANDEVFEDPEEESAEDPNLSEELSRLLAASSDEEELDEESDEDDEDDEEEITEETSSSRRRSLKPKEIGPNTNKLRHNLRAVARVARSGSK